MFDYQFSDQLPKASSTTLPSFSDQSIPAASSEGYLDRDMTYRKSTKPYLMHQ